MSNPRTTYIEAIRHNLAALENAIWTADVTVKMALDNVDKERSGISHGHLEDLEKSLEMATVLHSTIRKVSRFHFYTREVEI